MYELPFLCKHFLGRAVNPAFVYSACGEDTWFCASGQDGEVVRFVSHYFAGT